ncbi:hypothetical protein HB839_09485 [Listeria sp. FSL L7-1699]|uniref:Uncharacterized protein n=1 Tax=Listeria farberi TaxID=2713500 RepID=A0ABR6SNJ4_9LIST|nr:hypothetical protein [Listeria farberi]MBC1375758.1 hypothetical protein [Listeria farberi]MBC1382223.1 hypothetical protein [Listeria farberi]
MKREYLSSISIDYELNADKELGEGDLEFYINGKNLCSYKKDGNLKSYSWNLFCVVTWMCENIEYIIGYDPFPLPVKGDTSLELISEADQFESEDIKDNFIKTITEFIRSFLKKASELTNDEEQEIKIENLSRQLQLIEE